MKTKSSCTNLLTAFTPHLSSPNNLRTNVHECNSTVHSTNIASAAKLFVHFSTFTCVLTALGGDVLIELISIHCIMELIFVAGTLNNILATVESWFAIESDHVLTCGFVQCLAGIHLATRFLEVPSGRHVFTVFNNVHLCLCSARALETRAPHSARYKPARTTAEKSATAISCAATLLGRAQAATIQWHHTEESCNSPDIWVPFPVRFVPEYFLAERDGNE